MMQKPKDIFAAQTALVLWVFWTSLYGTYETWVSLPELEVAITSQLQGMVSFDTHLVMQMTVAWYVLVALTAFWVIYKIGQGRAWARSSLAWCAVLQTLWVAAPPYHPLPHYWPDVPDLGLQLYAVYLLYLGAGDAWFVRRTKYL